MSNNINPFSPWNVKEYVEDKVNFVSESCEEEMYNSVVVNTDKKSDCLESFFTNNDKNNYDSVVTHAYQNKNKKQPSVPPEDKPGPQPPGPGPKPEPPVWPANNIIWYSTTDNENVTINNPATRFFGSVDESLQVVSQGELPEPVVFDTHTKVNRYIELSGHLVRINGGAFKNTSNLENIIFPESLKCYGPGGELFNGSNVNTVVFGPGYVCSDGTYSAGPKMFINCMNLQKVYCYSDQKPIFRAASCFAAKDAGNTGEDYSSTIRDFIIYEPINDEGMIVGIKLTGFNEGATAGTAYFNKQKQYYDYIDRLPLVSPIIYS